MRVTLGRPQAADTLAISVAMMDPEFSGWLRSFPYPYNRAQTAPVACDPSAVGPSAILVDGRFAGMVMAAPELGCWLNPKYRGQGVALRAATLALSRYFQGGAQEAHGRVLTSNAPMRATFLKLGFVLDDAQSDGAPLDGAEGVELYRLSRNDFARSRPFSIQTARCQISGVTGGDLDELYDLAVRRDSCAMPGHFSPAMTIEDFAKIAPSYTGELPFSASIRLQGKVIGMIGIGAGRDAPLELCIAAEATGLGIGTEILAAFCREMSDRYQLDSLWGDVTEDNLAAIRMLQKCGFQRETADQPGGRLRYRLILEGQGVTGAG